tara:strand:+ start:22228 stop:23127 length:900 start_codon:yes stop_codon:yes gene_type:complete
MQTLQFNKIKAIKKKDMKKVIKFLVLSTAIIFASCEDVEPTVFNGADSSNPTLIGFSRDSYNLEVERDGTGSVDVVVNTTTLSTSARTYTVTVNVTDAENAAIPETFTVPATVTIPANEYQGILTITGVDNGLVDSNARLFTITLSGFTNESVDSDTSTVRIYEVCNIEAEFTGTYQVTSAADPVVGDSRFIPNGIYEITASSRFSRVLTANPYSPGYPQGNSEIEFNFICGNTTLSAAYTTGLACGSAPEQYVGVAPTTGGTYNPNDDSSFTVVIRTNPQSPCGVAPANITYQFTKVE